MAGRPKGSPNKKSMDRNALVREAVAAAQAAGVEGAEMPTPKQIAKMSMVEIMVFAAVQQACAGDWITAADIASKVAPYRHARLSQVTTDLTIRRSVTELSDEELVALAGEATELSESEGDSGAISEESGAG